MYLLVHLLLTDQQMTLQWTAVATFLYVEIGILLLLCIPFISAKRYEGKTCNFVSTHNMHIDVTKTCT